MLLLDVTPLTLGIETTGGVMAAIIPRNTVIPTSKTQRYTTSEDNQIAVTNKVFEGERPLSKDNRQLGLFELSGFPAMKRGEAQIDVTFDVDANGILSVSAREASSGTNARIRIDNVDRLKPEEIDRLVNEAEQYTHASTHAGNLTHSLCTHARTALASVVHSSHCTVLGMCFTVCVCVWRWYTGTRPPTRPRSRASRRGPASRRTCTAAAR